MVVIWYSPKIISLTTALDNIPGDDIFLKMDIEVAEYQVIDQIIHNQSRIPIMAIEFHNIRDNHEHYRAIQSLLKHYHIVHTAANNYHTVTDGEKTDLVELTFIRKDIKCEPDNRNITYPRADLDRPQIPENPIISKLIFED